MHLHFACFWAEDPRLPGIPLRSSKLDGRIAGRSDRLHGKWSVVLIPCKHSQCAPWKGSEHWHLVTALPRCTQTPPFLHWWRRRATWQANRSSSVSQRVPLKPNGQTHSRSVCPFCTRAEQRPPCKQNVQSAWWPAATHGSLRWHESPTNPVEQLKIETQEMMRC